MTRRNVLTAIACYVGVIVLALGFAVARDRTQKRFAFQSAPDVLPETPVYTHPPDKDAKPFFSLVTNRTYATTDRARLWINYRGLDQLDFRVYRVNDPAKFFKQLDDPHSVGEDEAAPEIAALAKRKPTFLEKLRAFKSGYYNAIKKYVRAQLQNQSRKGFNQRFRKPDEEADEAANRTPLNVSDYARVPLLNPDQMVTSWREKLPPLEDIYDRRQISLGKRDAGVYLVEAVKDDLRAYGVVIVTDLTMVQKVSNDGQMLIYAVDRKSGAPREGVQIEIVRGKNNLKSGTTDKQGIVRIKLDKQPPAGATETSEEEEAADEAEPPDEEAGDSYLLMARAGENFAISDLDSFYFNGGEEETAEANLTSYIYTDRPVYRPEQKVYFKGILRELTEKGYKLRAERTVSVTVEDTNGTRIYEQELPISSRGTFSGELDLPEETTLGYYNISAQIGEATATGQFGVEEYKKPEFKAKVTVPQKYTNVGEKTKFSVSASYFFGAPVTRADVKYYVYRDRYYPWWEDDGEAEADEFGADPSVEEDGGSSSTGYGNYNDQMMLEGEGKLNAQGLLEVEFTVPQADPKETWDYTYRLEAQVTDASRRTMDASASFLGVRGNTVATAAPERYVYYQNDTARVVVKTRDREGRPVQTEVKLTFVERRWEKVTKRTEYGDEYAGYDLKERELSSRVVQTNQQGEAAYDYTVQVPGSVHVKTTVVENGREITSEGGSIWVADRDNRWTDLSYEEEGTIKLVPDKKTYRVGETAHILALLPTDKAHLLVTTELMSVLDARRVDSTGRAIMIDVPIKPEFAPNVFLNVTYVRGGEMYTQEQMLVVPARDRLLSLEIIPNKKEFRPRETASYTVLARNGDGSPASGAEVSFGVVDESIYSIAPESIGDIRREFYGRRYNQVQTSFAINYGFTGYAGKKSIQLAQHKKPPGLADIKNEGELVNPRVRKIFKDTAFWQPNIVTGTDGKATVKVELPDNLTTWRATARAVTADTRVGTAVNKIVERKDVIIRIAMPRFLTAGDTVTLSGIVHNYLPSDKTTQISLDVRGGRLLDGATKTVNIPRQGEHRIDWRVAVPTTGELQILAKALTDTESDAVETALEIVPRGLKLTRADSVAYPDEELDKGYTFTLPANADPNARSLRIEVAPSIAGTLFGALDYLTGFPYGCTEQTMSQFLPTVIVKQTLRDVQTASIRDSNDIDRKVRRGLRRLYNYQHDDGGWGWWKDDTTDAFMTAYVIDGLSLAKRAGYQIDDARLERGRKKLKAVIDSGKNDASGGELDAETRAYMIYALNQSGEIDAGYLNDLFAKRNNLQPYGRALLALALNERGDTKRAATVAGEIERSARTDNRGAHWPSRHKTLHGSDETNDVEATALSLKALARIMPQSALLPNAARWLVSSRKNGYYWQSTKETAFAIFGLTDYLKASNELSPDYTLEVYLNGEQMLARQVTAADATGAQTFVVQRRGGELGNTTELRIVKRGRGALYVSSTLVHHTNEEQVAEQASPQLKITREYQRLRIVENSDGTPAWKLEPLSGELRSGDTIVARLRVEGQRASYLLIEDPIPAGCEQVESVSGIDLNRTEKDWSDWYSAREFRDQRTAFFVNYFDGSATYTYAMRVQVPGQFRVAPARVEQMYQPSVQSNTASAAMTILDSK